MLHSASLPAFADGGNRTLASKTLPSVGVNKKVKGSHARFMSTGGVLISLP